MKPALLLLAVATVAAAVADPAQARQDAAPGLADLLGGGRLRGAALEAAVSAAAEQPLGSRENPVRVSMPLGQHNYLRRLRCSDGQAPQFSRVGSFGPGVFGSIIDGYRVACGSGHEPTERIIFMDMYHPGHDETDAPEGFTLKARARQP